MADDVKILIKALLDTKDMQSQLAELAKEIIVKARVELDSVDLKRQINAVAGEGAKSGSKYKIKYGVDRGDFVKQFRAAGEEAKREIQKVIGSGDGIKVPMSVSTKAIDDLKTRLKGMGLGDEAIKQATAGLAAQNIQVSKISEGFRTIGARQEELARITISGTDALGRQVNLVQKFDLTRKKYLQTETQITAKFNEQGQIVNKMATSLRTKDIGTIKEMNTNDLATFVERIKNAGLYTDEMRDKTNALAITLKNAFSKEGMTEFLNQFDILKTRFKTIQEAAREASRPSVNTIDKNVGILNQTLAFKGMDGQTAGVTNLRNEITSLVAEYGRLKISMDGLDPSSAEFQALATQVDGLDARFKSATQAADVFNGTIKSNAKLEGVVAGIKKAKSSLDELEMKWSKFKGNPQLLGEFQQLRTAAQQLDATNLQNFNKQLAAFKTHVRAAGADTRNFGDELKNALAKFGIWMSAGTILMQGIRRIKDMVNAVKELDTALVEFNKIADLSSEELVKFTDRAFEAGKALARTGTEVLAASAIWKQAGYTVEESLKLAESSLMMQNVGDGIENVQQASSSLVAALKGFQLPAQDAERVLDALNNTSNNNAVGFAALAEGVQRASGVMRQSGTTMAETMGLLTGGYESLRNMEKVSTGLITLSQRIRGVNEDGEEIDGLAPKLQAIFKEIAGVDVQDQNGNLRSTYDILQDLAGAWDTLSSKQKQYIGEKAAGIRQISVFNAIIDNFNSVRKATDDAANSAGSAREENEKFLDSIQGRLNNLTSAFQAFSANTINSGFIKGIVDIVTSLVALIDKIGALPMLLTGLSLFTKSFTRSGLIYKSVFAFTQMLVGIPKTLSGVRQAFELGKRSGKSWGDVLSGAGVKAQLAFTGALVALSLLKFGFDAIKNHYVEQSKRAQEFVDSWEEARNTLAKTKDTIDDIGEEFETLGKGVDSFGNNISLTSDEFSKYHQITNQIAGMFPKLVSGYDSQGNAILNVKSNVESLTNAYKAQIAEQNDAIITGAPTVFEDTKVKYSDGNVLDATSIVGKNKAVKELIDAIDSSTGDVDLMRSGSMKAVLDQMGGLAESSQVPGGVLVTIRKEDKEAATQFLKSYFDMLDAETAIEASKRKSIISAYLSKSEDYRYADEQTKGIVDYVVANLDDDFILQQETPSSMWDTVASNVLKPLTKNEGLTNAITGVTNAGIAFRNSEKSIKDYSSTYANLQEEMKSAGLGDKIIEAVNKSIVDPKEYEPYKTRVKSFLVDGLDDIVESMTLRELKLGSALEVDEGAKLTLSEFQQMLEIAKKTLTALTLTENVATLKTVAEVANSAFKESEESGVISKETYDKLAELGEDYANTVDASNGYLTINKQKIDDLIVSKQEEIRAQIEFNKALGVSEEETRKLEIALAELNRIGTEYSTETARQQLANVKRDFDSRIGLYQGNIGLAESDISLGGATGREIKASDYNSLISYTQQQLAVLIEARAAYQKTFDDLVSSGAIQGGSAEWFEYTGNINAMDIAINNSIISLENLEDTISDIPLKNLNTELKSLNTDQDVLESEQKLREAKGETLIAKDYELLIDSGAQQIENLEAQNTILEGQQSGLEELSVEYQAIQGQLDANLATILDIQIAQAGWNNTISDIIAKSSLSAQIADIKAAAEVANATFGESAYSGSISEEGYKKLVELGDDYAATVDSTNGYLTVNKQKLDALIASKQADAQAQITINKEQKLAEYNKNAAVLAEVQKRFVKLTSTMDTNSDEYKALFKNLTDVNKEYEDSQDKLRNEIKGYNALSSELNYATSAYKRWLDAKNAPEAGDAYDELSVARKAIQEGLESGKTGTNKYLAAEALLVPEKVTAKGKSAVEKYLKSMDRYLTTDSKGLQKFLDTLYGKGFLEDGGDDKYYATQKANIQDIAKELNITEEAARLMFAALKDYGATFEIADSVLNQNIEAGSESVITEEVNTLADSITQAWSVTTVATDGLPIKVDTEDAEVSLAHLANSTSFTEITAPKEIVVEAALGGAYKAVSNFIDDTNNRKAILTVEADVKEPDAPKSFWGTIADTLFPRHAKGTKKAKKGVALTGEEGIETVFDKDGFYTVGHGGPELVNLQGGEEILTNEETKKLFGRKSKRVSGQTFATGTEKKNLWDIIASGVKTVVTSASKGLTSIVSSVTKGTQTVTGSTNTKIVGTKTPSKGGSSAKPEEPDFVDWIEPLLDRLRKQAEDLVEQSESLVEYTAQNAKLNEAIGVNAETINASNSAYARYMQQANMVGLSGDLINKVQNGLIDIQAYDEATQKLISNYQKWYDLAQDTLDTVSELRKEQTELALRKLSNVQQYYENRIGSYASNVDLAQSAISLGQATGREIKASDYNGIFADLQAQLGILREEREVYAQTFNQLVSSGVIKSGSNEWYEYTGNISNMDKAINDASISLDDFKDIAKDIPIKNLDIAIKYLNTVQSTLESVQGLREAQGKALEPQDYERLISIGMQQIKTLETQNKELKNQQKGLDVLSDEYQEIQDKIDGNLSSIWDIKTTQENWSDAIIDLDIAKLEEVNDRYDKQLRTMEAIENLEKAKQRRSLVYREGQGFVYEADQSDIKTAQREYDDVLFENLIDTLEGLKKDDNVYDSAGKLVGKQFTSLDGVNFQNYLSSVLTGKENSALLNSAIGQINYDALKGGGAKSNAVSFNGDIILNGVNDAQGLAEALRLQLPSYISQLWFSNN